MASRKNVNFRMTAQDDTGRGVSSVRSRLERLGQSVTRVFAGGLIAGGITALFSRTGSAIDGVLQRLDDVAKKARELEVTPQVLTELKNVGDLVGVADEALIRLVVRFRTGTETTNKALERLGIKLEAFQKLDATEQLAVVVNQISKLPNIADRTAAAVEIAGDRQARSLLRLVSDGAGAFQELIAQQRALGSESANQAAKDAEEINDTFTVIGQGLSSLVNDSVSSTKAFAQNLLDASGATEVFSNRTIVNFNRVRESIGLLADESIAAKTFDFVPEAEKKKLEEAVKLSDDFFKEMERADKAAFDASKKWAEEVTKQQEQLLDNLISRLERVRDSLREDQTETIDLRFTQRARASQALTQTQDRLSLAEQQKTNQILTELVRFARTGNPAVFG